MPIACAPTAGRVRSKVAIDGWLRAGPRRPRGPWPAARRASPCRRAGSGRGPGTWSSTTSAVCEARMPCLGNFWPWLSPLVPGGTTKLACPRVRRSGSTTAVTTWTSAMPPLVAQVLVPLRTHSSVASSYVARVRIAPTSLPASGSEEQNAPSLRSPGVPNICGDPLADLLVGAVGADAGGGQRGADDREPDAGVTPEQLLHRDREAEPGLVEAPGSRRSRRSRGRPWRPPRRTGQGNSSFSSHSAAAGRTTSAAKVCTQSRRSRWSWPRSNEGVVTGQGNRTTVRG